MILFGALANGLVILGGGIGLVFKQGIHNELKP